MRNKKRIMLAIILFMVIGFASISTLLIINGGANLLGNQDDFDGEVYFSKGESDDGEAIISQDQKTITFTSDYLSKINETATLNYEVVNNSKNYDADVTITCVLDDESHDDYLEITPTPLTMMVSARAHESGSITVKVKKSYFDEAGLEVGFTCTLDASAVEREEKPSENANKVTVQVDENGQVRNMSKVYGKRIGEIGEPSVPEGYEFIRWEDEEGNALDENMIITKNIKIIAKSSYGKNLYKLIQGLSIASSTTLNFSISSQATGENGVYQLAEDNKVYFYRGSVDNNIIFNNICWKIIRTTNTDGIKLIYNGIPVEGKCTTQTGQATTITTGRGNYYNGKRSGVKSESDYKGSEMQARLEAWYVQNLTSVDSKIEDTPYCSDMTEVPYNDSNINNGSSSYIYFAAAKRMGRGTKNVQPSLNCASKYAYTVLKGDLEQKIGLITLDEAVLAGFTTSYDSNTLTTNNICYLYNDTNYWTMSPIEFRPVTAMTVHPMNYVVIINRRSYSLGLNDIQQTMGDTYYREDDMYVRPVISLKDGVRITPEGNGTVDSPYVVVE